MGHRTWMGRSITAAAGLLTVWAMMGLGFLLTPEEVDAIPAFARKYQTACQTCHVIIPKLNSFGEAFRLNGYQIPDVDELYVKDEPLVLGAEPWKEMFPQAIWPASIPGIPPISLRLITDFQHTSSDGGIGGNPDTKSNFEFPHEFEILSAGRIGDSIGFMVEAEWYQGGGIDVKQGYLVFNPTPRMNIKVGLMDHQLMLSNNNTTRVGKNHPLWGNKKPSDWNIGGLDKSSVGFRLQDNQAGVEVSGVVARRLFLGAGLVNGNGGKRFDNNNHKDTYFKAKLKLFGRDFLGAFDDGGEISMDTQSSGSWVDNSLLLEGFGYFGEWSGDPSVDQNSFSQVGLSARATVSNLDLSIAYVKSRHDNPWFTAPATESESDAMFAKAEYMFYPWLMGRLLYETLDWEEPPGTSVGSGYKGSLDQKRLLFGPVIAIRANIRAAFEFEYYTHHEAAEVNNLSKPNSMWIRLDYAF